MKNSIKYTVALFMGGMIGLSACTDSFENYNKNQNSFPEELQSYDFQKQLIPFKTIQKAIIYQTGIEGTNWQYQTMQNLVADMFGGYFHDMLGTFNNQNSTYALNTAWCASQWNQTYAQGLPVIATAEDINKKEEYPAFYSVNKILKVAMMHRVSDYYGPILYKNFGGKDQIPESQKDVYNAFFADLDEAVTTLKTYLSNNGGETFSKADIMMPAGKRTYSQWIKFANSLRLRLAIRVSNVDKALAQKQTLAALDVNNGGVLTEASETVGEYGVSNPLGGVTSWSEVFMNASMESFLVGFEDPRLEKYYVPAVGNVGSDGEVKELFPIKGKYKGVRQGTGITSDNRYKTHSKSSITPSSDIIVMTAAEIWFLRAEAALRGFTNENVEACYKKGVETSFAQWGAGSASEYLASEKTPAKYIDAFDAKFNGEPTTQVTPKWTGGSMEQQLEQIITQKWIALYPEGCEAWAEQRRTGYPKLFKVVVNNAPTIINTDIMVRRATYPQDYKESNATLYNALVQLLGGTDNGGTRLWWDAGKNNF